MAAVRSMENNLLGFTVKSILRNDNFEADDLAKAVAQNLPIPPDVFYQNLKVPAVETPPQAARSVTVIESEDWRSPIMAYLRVITSQKIMSRRSMWRKETESIKLWGFICTRWEFVHQCFGAYPRKRGKNC